MSNLVKNAEVENKEHPCMSCSNLATRKPSHLAYVSAQYVATALMKECQAEEPDASAILRLAQATAILIRVS